MKENYKIYDYLKDENKQYKWYNDIINGKMARYKMDKPRPYDDADYYTAISFDRNIWYLCYKGQKIGVEIVGIDNTNVLLINFNKNINSRMIHN